VKSDWLFAVIGGLIGAGVTFVLLDVPIAAGPTRMARGPALQVAWEGLQPEPAIAAEARLMDPSVLFLPSALTAATRTTAAAGNAVAFSQLAWREPPEFAFHSNDLRLTLPAPMPAPASPAEALQVHPPGNPDLGFGRKDLTPPTLPRRSGWIEVTDMTTGRIILARALSQPLVSDGSSDVVQPSTFFVTVAPDGVVGEPVPAGVGAVPSKPLEKQLDEVLSEGHRFGAGFYRISVGP
jgi:hypothetical protein